MAAYPHMESPRGDTLREDTPRGRSLVGLFSDLLRESSTLVQEEAALAKAEISEKVSQLVIGLIVMIVGYIALSKGRKEFKAESLKPSRTMDSLRRDTELVKGHLSTSRST